MNVRARQKALGNAMRSLARNKAPLTTQAGFAGGFLLVPEVIEAVDESLQEMGIFHSLAFRQPMESTDCTIAGFDVTVAHAAGTSPLMGGMTLNWLREGQLGTLVAPSFGGGKLTAWQLEGYVLASNQLVADGGAALGAYLERQFAMAIEWFVEKECFTGSGVARPTGIVGSASTAQVTRQATGHVSQQDFGNMVASLLPGCFKNAVWAFHPTTMQDIVLLPTYMSNRNSDSTLQTGLCGTLYARPAYCTEKLNPKGTAGDLVLFDPTMYALGTREIEVASATEDPLAFRQNQTMFRLLWRGDGQPIPRGTALLQDNSTRAGAFVSLQ